MSELEFLSSIPFLQGLSHSQIQPLAPHLRWRNYRPGQVIFHQDDPGGELYIIATGQVRISIVSDDGRESDIALLESGDCFGEVSLLDGQNRSATATASSLTTVMALSQEGFDSFISQTPEACRQIVRMLCGKLRNADQLLGDLLFLDVPTRLARQLVRLVGSHSRPMQGLDLEVDQDQLARLVGASRESVNRCLRLYEGQGVLRTSRRRIIIDDFDALQSAASLGSDLSI